MKKKITSLFLMFALAFSVFAASAVPSQASVTMGKKTSTSVNCVFKVVSCSSNNSEIASVSKSGKHIKIKSKKRTGKAVITYSVDTGKKIVKNKKFNVFVK